METEIPSGRDGRFDASWRRRPGHGDQSVPTQMIAGLMIMAVGVALVLGRLGFLRIENGVWPHLWPLLLIGFGLGKLLTPRPDGTRRGDGLLLVGVWLLLNELDIVRAGESWPLFMVAFGLKIVWNAVMVSRDGQSRVE